MSIATIGTGIIAGAAYIRNKIQNSRMFGDGGEAGYSSFQSGHLQSAAVNASGRQGYLNDNSSNGAVFPNGNAGRSEYDDIEVLDNYWVMSRCLIPGVELEEEDNINRRFTTTYWKFTNTQMGGNIGVNPKPQYTRYADIRSPSAYASWNATTIPHNTGDLGMGRYYSEAIDDNAQVVYFEFGVPKFSSLLDFFSNAIDYRESVIANEGRDSFWYEAGELAGSGVFAVAFPQLALMVWIGGAVVRLFGLMSPQVHRYYYLKPTMHTYWGAVNTLVTQMATELGILTPRIPLDNNSNAGGAAPKIGLPVKFDDEDMQALADLYPGIIDPDTHYIDVFRIALRPQMMINAMLNKENQAYFNNDQPADYVGYVKTLFSQRPSQKTGSAVGFAVSKFQDWLGIYVKDNNMFNQPKNLKSEANDGLAKFNAQQGGNNGISYNEIPKDEQPTQAPDDPPYGARDDDGQMLEKNVHKSPASKEEHEKYMDSWRQSLEASATGGARFATFYVDYTGSVSDSFSSSTGPISSETGAKSIAQAGRNFNFMLGGGDVAAGVDNVIGAAKDFVSGALNGMSFGLSNILQSIFGGAYIDMPNKWEDSESNLANVSYSMTLISPYNNPISQLQNIYIPLAMLMAGALPLGTGRSSYTSPFICSCFDRGVQHIRLGMITSLSIERGTSNLAFARDRKPLAVNVSFTVTNLSNALTVPMSASLFSTFKVTLMDDSPMGEYISTLCSRSHLVSAYTALQWKLRLSRLIMSTDQIFNKESWALRIGEFVPSVASNAYASLLSDSRLPNAMF